MKKIIFLAASSIILWSCKNNAENNKPTIDTTIQEKQQETHNETSEVIELNNGNKWLINIEMKPFITEGQKLVAEFLKTNNTDYKSLAKSLIEQNNLLIKSCTMTGKSHDELHKWLEPHLKLVEDLEATTDATKAKEIVSKIEQSYQSFGNFFE
ncbi:MAG TPA: hypothetical protein PKG56_07180 [Chitinophagaceae bacterium]|nr:hypothetical protein [Chitinophagaceae bacterium]HMZ46559.1 hypothetical protein [Chitinophagaceae bacterium]HNE93773.1 hypothetical protein [Chitinophagaceae bacterium]HNJ59220.1 hypothetical protein [Chitinophagaceae bacterium]HNL83160.1 hypothetical protein [Chitinophagaceae bacterium]